MTIVGTKVRKWSPEPCIGGIYSTPPDDIRLNFLPTYTRPFPWEYVTTIRKLNDVGNFYVKTDFTGRDELLQE